VSLGAISRALKQGRKPLNRAWLRSAVALIALDGLRCGHSDARSSALEQVDASASSRKETAAAIRGLEPEQDVGGLSGVTADVDAADRPCSFT
jgi:hypothetical protein